MRRLIPVLMFLLLIAACKQESGAAMGDTVIVNYIGKFENGTVFDTSVEQVGRAAGVEKSQYNPLTITIGKKQVIPGFEFALIDMKEGEKKTVTLPPSQAYGIKRPGQILSLDVRDSINRTVQLEREVEVLLDKLEQLPGDDNVGDVVEVGDISYEVISKGNKSAILRIDVDEGDKVVLPNTLWNSTVVEVEDDYYYVRHDPENGSIMNTPFGPVRLLIDGEKLTRVLLMEEGGSLRTEAGVGRVTSVNDTKAVIDFNHPLAGQTLVFEIELVRIV